MKKIQTAEAKSKKARRNKIVVGTLLVFLMVFSTLGYSFMSGGSEGTGKVKENGRTFYKVDGLWRTSIDDQNFAFRYLPSEVVDVQVDSSIYDLGEYVGQPLYFVNANEASGEILNNIRGYVLRYQEACTSETDCKDSLPLKECNSNLIIYEPGNDTKVYKNESCVYLVGDAMKAADAFLYETLHI